MASEFRKSLGEISGKESALKITVSVENPDVLESWENLDDDFQRELANTNLRLLLDVNKYLIRVTPLDTGELRGGWTAFLDANQEDYTRQIYDSSLAIKARGRVFHITPEGITKGKSFSTWELPTPLDFTLTNSVPYGFFLEHGTSKMQGRNFLAITRYKAELRFTQVYTQWFEKMNEAGKVVPADIPEGEEIFP